MTHHQTTIVLPTYHFRFLLTEVLS